MPAPVSENEGPVIVLNTIQPSLFASVGVGGSNTSFLVDSGSSVTLVGVDLYSQLDQRYKPELKSCRVRLTTASGSNLVVFGKADFALKLGDRSFIQEAIVVTLQGLKGILGIDFLSRHGGELNFGVNTLKLGDHRVELSAESVGKCAQIRVSDTV